MAGFTKIVAWLLTVLLATFLVYWLWNAVLVRALNTVNPISFLSALGVTVLARLLFGPNVIHEQVLLAGMPRGLGLRASPRRRR